MSTVLITAAVFGIAFVGMAIGVIISNKVIKGSCGGLGALFGAGACDMCEKRDQCKKEELES